jgi:nicotinamide-nucleotide amidase
MQADIITIGDELLIGQTINTNASWIGKELSIQGVNIGRSTTISDTREEILSAIDEAFRRSDFVIVTGGLGPTKDDITKETLCEYFETSLESKPDVLERIKSYFEQKGREMLPTNIQQADLPKDCIVLDNYLGTASGMWFEKNGKVLVSIPGVPYEMKALMTKEVMPRAKAFFGFSGTYHETLMTQGIGESWLADKIADWEERIYKDGLSLAYLPSPGIVKLRLTAKDGAEKSKLIKGYFDELRKELPKYAYGMNGESIFEVVADLLRSRGCTLSTVESCTGGGLANAFVQLPGASDFFQGGFITYSNQLKMNLANVQQKSLEKFGAVSEEVVTEMAVGGRTQLKTDYCIAVSGIAGPDGGTEEKPVGTVWIAVSSAESTIAKSFRFGNDRGRNLTISALTAANMLRRLMLDIA